LIHTSKKFPPIFRHLCHQEPFKTILNLAGVHNPDELPLGKIIGITWIEDVISLDGFIPGEPERSFGDYSPGRIGLVLKDSWQFAKPIPAIGQQGLWNFDINAVSTCADCAFDVPSADDPNWKECDAPEHIADKIYEKHSDVELPKYCGQFQPKAATGNG
jgi:hypothetical protein